MTMDASVPAMAVILAMAAVTLFARWIGYYLIGFVKVGPRVEAAFQTLPGAVVMATILPIIVREGVVALAAVLVSVLMARRGFGDFAAVVVALGMAIAWRYMSV